MKMKVTERNDNFTSRGAKIWVGGDSKKNI